MSLKIGSGIPLYLFVILSGAEGQKGYRFNPSCKEKIVSHFNVLKVIKASLRRASKISLLNPLTFKLIVLSLQSLKLGEYY